MEKRTATTGCGQGTVFGDLMEDIESIQLDDDMRVDEETLFGLLNAVRVHESIYKQAGAVHGCALARGEEILTFVEDVGRHNAVDAIAGWMWLEGIDGRDKIFYTTGASPPRWSSRRRRWGFPSSCRARGSRRWATRSRARSASR
jgi:FdhD protein